MLDIEKRGVLLTAQTFRPQRNPGNPGSLCYAGDSGSLCKTDPFCNAGSLCNTNSFCKTGSLCKTGSFCKTGDRRI